MHIQKRIVQYKEFLEYIKRTLVAASIFTIGSTFNMASANTQLSGLTKLEWNAWPDFCRAAIANSGWGSQTLFAADLDRRWVSETLKPFPHVNGIGGPHHFCVGMLYIDRTRTKFGDERNRLLIRAIDELSYSFERTKKSAPRFSLLTAYYGKAYYLMDKKEQALSIWNLGMKHNNGSPESHLAFAEALLSENKNEEALEILLQFSSSTKTAISEVEYFLGQVYFNLKNYDKSKQHADNAYDLGYPLPGLRNKLKDAGIYK